MRSSNPPHRLVDTLLHSLFATTPSNHHHSNPSLQVLDGLPAHLRGPPARPLAFTHPRPDICRLRHPPIELHPGLGHGHGLGTRAAGRLIRLLWVIFPSASPRPLRCLYAFWEKVMRGNS